jgi:cysteine synthase
VSDGETDLSQNVVRVVSGSGTTGEIAGVSVFAYDIFLSIRWILPYDGGSNRRVRRKL